jgi:hypothetical protein
MRWLLWIVGSLALLVALLAIAGAMLPKKHMASRSTRVALPPAALYPILVQMAQASKVPVRLERQEPPSLLVARIADPKLPFGGTWTYRIVPAGADASELTITEDGEVYNVIFRFMARFVFGYYGTIDAFIKDLQVKAAR